MQRRSSIANGCWEGRRQPRWTMYHICGTTPTRLVVESLCLRLKFPRTWLRHCDTLSCIYIFHYNAQDPREDNTSINDKTDVVMCMQWLYIHVAIIDIIQIGSSRQMLSRQRTVTCECSSRRHNRNSPLLRVERKTMLERKGYCTSLLICTHACLSFFSIRILPCKFTDPRCNLSKRAKVQ